MLGLHAIKRWPHLFHAFAGTGHFVSWVEALRGQEKATREAALAGHDQAALDALDESAKLPETDVKRIIAANKYRWPASDLEYLKIQQAFIGEPPPPEKGDVADWMAGGGFSVPKLLPVIFAYDARKIGLDIPVPFFAIHGRDDRVTPLSAVESYMAQVRAPAKRLIPIGGGHFACFTNPTEFVEALREHVRPLSKR
jgi:pimeloyl-ACP methyl ester carboxylesterase